MKARIIKTGEIVEVYHEPQHGQVSNVYKESVLVNGRMWIEDELDFCVNTNESSDHKKVSLDKVCNFLIDNLKCSVDFDEYGNGIINESNWCSEKYNTISEFIEGLRKEFK